MRFVLVFLSATLIGGGVAPGQAPAPCCRFTDPLVDESVYTKIPLEENGRHYIWKEAEDFVRIVPSLEVDWDRECSGGKSVVLREGNGSAWCGVGTGRVEYVVNVPKSDSYTFWGRAKWEDGCGNGFDLNMGSGVKPKRRPGMISAGGTNAALEMFGKDTTLDTWHWYAASSYYLSEGEHKIAILAHDDGWAIDKFLLCNDPDFVPQGFSKPAFEGNFSTARTGGWRIKTNAWQVSGDKMGGYHLTKMSDGDSPALLDYSGWTNAYLSFRLHDAKAFNAYLGWGSAFSCIRVSSCGRCLRVTEYKFGKAAPRVARALSAGEMLNGTNQLIEVFRLNGKITVMLNGRMAAQADIESREPGRIGIDTVKGGSIAKVRVDLPDEPIHLATNLYFPWGLIPFNPVQGLWAIPNEDHLTCTNSSGPAILTAGEEWWHNYQVTCMMRAPEQGSAGILARYHDPNNYYMLRVTRKNQTLVCMAGGREQVLGESVGDFTAGRVTLNCVDDVIQAFCNGKKLFQVKDQTFFNGCAGFICKAGAKPNSGDRTLNLDDIEIWSLDAPCRGTINEDLPVFRNGEYIPTRYVGDRTSSIGSTPPWETAASRGEDQIRAIETQKLGRKTDSLASVLGYCMVSFWGDSEFAAVLGDMKQSSGSILGTATNGRPYLWSMSALGGNWNFQCDVKSLSETVGMRIQEWSDSPVEGFDYTVAFNRKTNKVVLSRVGLEVESVMTNIVFGAKEATRLQAVRCNNELTFFVNGDRLFKPVPMGNVLVKPAVFYGGGDVSFDNVIATVKPDLFYHFTFNEPGSLAQSDWTFQASWRGYVGGYFGRLRVANESGKSKSPVSMTSRRTFKGDFMADILLWLDVEQPFSMDLVNAKSKSALCSCRITKNDISLYGGSMELAKEKLKYFNMTTRELTTIRLWIKDNMLRVYLTDGTGSDRLALKRDVGAMRDTPFNIRYASVGHFEVKQIAIFGTTVEE